MACAERSPLLRGLSVERAIDIVWSFNGHDLYLNLVEGCGWSPSAYETWLGDSLALLLFGADPR